MTRYCVRLGLTIRPTEPDDDVDSFTDDFLAALLALDPEADLMGSIAAGEFQVWVHAEADDVVGAVVAGTATVRAAGHAVNGHTPNWPTADEWPRWIETRSVEAHVDDEDQPTREAAGLTPA